MTVARILDEKGRDVFTTQPHRTLKEVIELLADKGVGAVVVSDASLSVLGIVSERDVVRVLAKHGASALDRSCVALHDAEGHHRDRARTRSTTSWQTMTAGRFRHVPIVQDGADGTERSQKNDC